MCVAFFEALGGVKQIRLRVAAPGAEKAGFMRKVLQAVLVFLLCSAHPLSALEVTVRWSVPAINEDGTPLEDLAGFKLYYGTSTRRYTTSITVGNATVATVTLPADGQTYYFAATAFDTAGNESVYSEEATVIALEATPTPQPTPTATPRYTVSPPPETPTPISPTPGPTKTPGRKRHTAKLAEVVGFEKAKTHARFTLFSPVGESSTGPDFQIGASAAQANGDFDGDGNLELGVVYRTSSRALQWVARRMGSNETVLDLSFGRKGDRALSGCFFDSDTMADPAVLHRRRFEILKSATASGVRVPISFTRVYDATCVDFDGDGIDELVVSGHKKGLESTLILSLRDGVLAQKRAAGISRLLVGDFLGKGSEQVVAVQKQKNGLRRLMLLYGGRAKARSMPKDTADLTPACVADGGEYITFTPLQDKTRPPTA